MSRNSYNSIKKYAAFIFMIFTVLSGSSDGLDSDSFVRVGRKAFIDILASNRLFIQDARVSSIQLRRGSSIKENEDFREFLDTYADNSRLNNIRIYVFPLIIIVLCVNNRILKNNIWKNAVF